MSQNISSAVMAQRIEPHDSLDFFPTPPWATRALCHTLTASGFDLSRKRCWEPACGEGHMARPLAEYFEMVFSSDVHGYGQGQVLDFLWPYEGPRFDWIVTNPPFLLGDQFAHTAIERAEYGVALFVRSQFLEGQARWRDLFCPRPPHTILQFTERVPLFKGKLDAKGSTASSYCWVIWLCRPHRPCPADTTQFAWIPPCRKRLELPSDYEGVSA